MVATAPAPGNYTHKPKKGTKTSKYEQKQGTAEPTRQDIKDAMRWVATHTNLVPTLVGPTASGKTRMVHEWAQEIDAELVSVLLSQHTPDEISGFQTEVKGELVAQMPYWFRAAQEAHAKNKPVILLFDELGLAREECRGALYTFFRDRELHGQTLDGETYVVAAMNPATLAPPFKTRSVMLHVPADRSYLMSFASHPLARRAAEGGNLTVEGDSAYSNEPPERPETVNAAAIDALNRLDAEFWNMSEPAQRSVLQALVPPATLEEMLRDNLDVSNLSRHPDLLREVLSEMEPLDALNTMTGVLETTPQLDPDEIAHAMFVIQDILYDDVENLLEPYMAQERPSHVRQGVQRINNKLFWELVEQANFVRAENGELKGTAIDRYIAQRGDE